MAQFFTDFTGQTVGSDPPTGWTHRWGDSAEWNVASGPALERASGPTGFHMLSWDAPGSISGDCEIYIRGRTSNVSGTTFGVAMHASTSEVSGLAAGFSGGTELARSIMTAGVEDFAGATTVTHVADTIYRMRVQRTGTTWRGRAWVDGGSEPGTWDFSVTHTTYTSGVIGVFARNGFPTSLWLAVGVGTAGDAAPTSAPSGSSVPVIAAGLRQRMNN